MLPPYLLEIRFCIFKFSNLETLIRNLYKFLGVLDKKYQIDFFLIQNQDNDFQLLSMKF